MFDYHRNHRYFALTPEGMEALALEELTELGARDAEPVFRGLYFTASRAVLYRIVYQSRLVSRVLAPLTSFDCRDPNELYAGAWAIDWPALFPPDRTFMVTSTVVLSRITHSQYALQRVKDAIADRFRDRLGIRPSVDRENPDIRVDLHLRQNRATLSLDMSGGPMHRRRYRVSQGEAPMRETVAAAILRWSGWDGEKPLWDPMCGSGTLLAEAVMAHCRIPSGYLRSNFGFEGLPDFDANTWEDVKTKADRRIRPLARGLVRGSDIDPAAVKAARENLARLPGGERVELRETDLFATEGFRDGVIVSNPPYGIRLGETAEVAAMMKRLGDFLKQRCADSSAFLYFGDRTLLKSVGLRPSWRKPLHNAALDGRLARYDIHARVNAAPADPTLPA